MNERHRSATFSIESPSEKTIFVGSFFQQVPAARIVSRDLVAEPAFPFAVADLDQPFGRFRPEGRAGRR